MKQAHILISGFVQGVGFRNFVKKNAQEVGLAGWVKNLPDKKVEALLQGDKEKIEEMINLCKRGPFLSEVENIEVNWEEIDKIMHSFEIIKYK